jgi:uncharacterized membrane protein YgcG
VLRKNSLVSGMILSLCVLAAARPAVAGVHQVWDEAHFLKLPTIDQVDQIINTIHDRFGKDLMIETFASIPDDLKPNLQKVGKDKFFEDWTISEGSELGLNGVIILVTGEPRHLQVEIGLETRKKAFTAADRTELITQMATAFRNNDFDRGILHAAQFVHDRMARNLGAGATTQPTTQPAAPATTQPTPEAGAQAPKATNLP